MRNFKKVLTICLTAVILVAAFSVNAFAAKTSFTDVDQNNEVLSNAVSLIEGIGVTKGVSKTNFGTESDVTRQQMAAFVYRLLKQGKSIEDGENTTSFTDLYDSTYNGMISWASSMGIIKGVSDTVFNPDGEIILQDAYTMLVRALGYEKDESIAYPHGYIDIAESKNVNLGEGLPSDVTYTTTLTRGDVAILLYNAFYAEMGETELVERERLIGAGTPNAKYVLETVEEHLRLCEKVYDVVEEKFVVRETTHYAFNDRKNLSTYKPTEDKDGVGSMLLVATERGQMIESFYTTAEELGLSKTADNYIMAELTLFYKYDSKNDEISKIYHTLNAMDKISADSLKYGSVAQTNLVNDPEKRYVADSVKAVRMNGLVTVADKQLYFFDAPYSFLTPSYADCETEEDRYIARNDDNTHFIDLECLDVEDGLYNWYITDDRFASKDGYDTDLDGALAIKLNTARMEGIYSVDIFDTDGDGRYEYMWYKPATFGQIIMDDDYTLYEDGINYSYQPYNKHSKDPNSKPQIYANEATLSGVAFNDEDFVIAYVNQDANMIHIYGVALGREGTITSARHATGQLTLGGFELRTCYQYRYLENFYQNDSVSTTDEGAISSANTSMFPFLTDINCVGTKARIYSYVHAGNTHIMYYEVISGSAGQYSGDNLLIPLETETVVARTEKFESVHYLKVLLNGEEKYVPVDVEKCYPQPRVTVDGTYKFDNTVTDENGKKYSVYDGKLCTFSVDKNGNYTLMSLLHGENKNGEADHIPLVFNKEVFFDEDKTTQVANDLGVYGADDPARLKKLTSKRYEILDTYGNDMVGTFGKTAVEGHWFKEVYITDDTVFLIKTSKSVGNKTEYELVKYKGTDFPGTTDSFFSNVQYIYKNRGDSTKAAELVLFYGEVEGEIEFETTVKKADYKIVKSSKIVKVAEDEYRFSYTLFNPATGELEENVLGTTEETTASAIDGKTPLAAGSITAVTSAGEVDDAEAAEFVLDAVTNENLAFITDVDLDAGAVELIPVRAEDEDYFTDENSGDVYRIFELDEDVTISMIKYGKKDDIDTAEMSVLTLEQLAKAGKDIKAYNKVADDNGKLSTEYANYVKAYITYTKNSRADFPTINSIVVVVNGGEPEEFLDIE